MYGTLGTVSPPAMSLPRRYSPARRRLFRPDRSGHGSGWLRGPARHRRLCRAPGQRGAGLRRLPHPGRRLLPGRPARSLRLAGGHRRPPEPRQPHRGRAARDRIREARLRGGDLGRARPGPGHVPEQPERLRPADPRPARAARSVRGHRGGRGELPGPDRHAPLGPDRLHPVRILRLVRCGAVGAGAAAQPMAQPPAADLHRGGRQRLQRGLPAVDGAGRHQRERKVHQEPGQGDQLAAHPAGRSRSRSGSTCRPRTTPRCASGWRTRPSR